MGKITDDDRKRIQRCCCKQCGGPLTMKVVVYDPYGGHDVEMFCEKCHKIEYGTEKEIYHLASQFIDQFQYNYFMDMVENEHSEQLNTAKLCEIIGWVFLELGLLDDNGIRKNTLPNFNQS